MRQNKLLSHVLAVLTVFAAVAGVPAQGADKKPNIPVIWGDDIGQSNISAYRYKAAAEEGGVDALVEKERWCPNLKNRTEWRSTNTSAVAPSRRLGIPTGTC
ncbi:MAG: hypothetical protein WAN46_19525 [Gammaproteobacteria bacterium]|jgi:hypothetical protein